jgi:endonuclease/exonuclease/phosphatase family metal-dependent hydrolase
VRRSIASLVLASLALSACGINFPAPSTPAPLPPPLTVVSYNIRHGEGMDDRVNIERTANVLRRLNPDIVGLQEVDNRVRRSGNVDQAAELGRLLGLNHSFGAFMDYQGGQYGMAILTRRPVVSSRAVELPEGNEPRIALAVELDFVDGSRLMVVNVHFDWVSNDEFRYAQASALARWLDSLSMPYLVMGDFNDRMGSRTLRLFSDGMDGAVKPEGRHLTFSSTNPRQEIDFIFLSRNAPWQIGSGTVIDEQLASDHRPVMTTLIPRGR